jgi:S1-C subfamily serine protease
MIGSDPDSDLAVIRIDSATDQLAPVQLGRSEDLQVGELAIAIGNPFGLEGTMTLGIISALGRSLPVTSDAMQQTNYTIPDIIQTDAPINPGNSGGVLVDEEGRVIGVTSAIESPVRANAGIGFAIPSTIVRKVVPALIENGFYQHPWLGISGIAMSPPLAEAMDMAADQQGILVVDVVNGSPADEAGLQGSDRQIEIEGIPLRVGGDIVVGIEGQPVNEFDDLVTYLARNTEVGQSITLAVLRDGERQSLNVTLAPRPSQQQRQARPEPTPTGGAALGIVGLSMIPPVAEAMDLAPGTEGVLVEQVMNGSPADEAGLEGSFKPVVINGQTLQIGGDIIVAADGRPITGSDGLRAFLQSADPGQEVTLTILREGEEQEVKVTLGELPRNTP